jgi:hypothetical protein
MSDVLKRTIFVDDTNGKVRFHEWAEVTTELGVMLETFSQIGGDSGSTKGGTVNYDATEAGTRIDTIQRLSMDQRFNIVGENLTGGHQLPRVGR